MTKQEEITNKEKAPDMNISSSQEDIAEGDSLQNSESIMPPQGGKEEQITQTHTTGRPRKSPEGRSVKLSIYLTPTLEADLKDLARIQRLSTPDYIFRLIERERDRRADALATFRALEEE